MIDPDSLLLAYGGPAELFNKITFKNKLFVDDERLRVPDQQRQYQSWRGVLRAGLTRLQTLPDVEYVHLAEYDQIPLVGDFREKLRGRLEDEGADIIGHHLHRIDGTSHPHYLFHRREERFHQHFASISSREDKNVVFSMLPTGSFWKRAAFEAVASREEPIPIYVELYLPTQAHHLGYRLRDLPDQNRFVSILEDRFDEIERARSEGAWSLHPVKNFIRSKYPAASP